MDYYQGVVTEYLRADRAIFLNTECCIQLNPGANPDTTGPHWFCDAVAADFRAEAVFLCEVSYARGLGALLRRFSEWNREWSKLDGCAVEVSLMGSSRREGEAERDSGGDESLGCWNRRDRSH